MVAKSYTFQESVEYLLSLGNEVWAMKLGLENIRKLLEALGKPAVNILKVQVAGTNGKGSVCAFLNSICIEAGIKTGLYTSPHLVSITERIKINESDLEEDEFARIASFVRDTSEWLVEKGQLESVPTFFEQVTAIALVAFANHGVELIILETGLGGRLDATTAANAEIAAITRIDYDHQQYLGETIEEIAAEKAAIIGVQTKVAVLGEQTSPAMTVLKARCDEIGIIPRTECEAWVWAVHASRGRAVAGFRTEGRIYDDVELGLAGRHQVENARIAVMIADILRSQWFHQLSTDAITDGLESARHPGRLEFIDSVLLDGAHNPSGAKALREFLDEFIQQPIVMIFGAMADKNVGEIAKILFPKADTIILTKAANPRAIEPGDLVNFVPPEAEKTRIILSERVRSALAQAKQHAGDDKLILVSGSLYLVGEVRSLLCE
jgi:dihydrofolate synthase/folylpolyglutamate synthase